MSSLYLEIQILEEQRVDREQIKIEKQRFRKQARRAFESKKAAELEALKKKASSQKKKL